DLFPVKSFQEEQRVILAQQLAHMVNCLLTTSMGRLFDAVSSLLGIRHHISYEGQAAIELENICDRSENQTYDLPINGSRIDTLALFPQILKDMRNGVSHAVIAARFHNAIANCCLVICQKFRTSTGVNKVALSGGVWQNMTLLRKTTQLLYSDGFEPLIHHRVPANDGGISLGQTLIAASLLHAL
ncbi:MAG TPA: hypothetical protein PKG92_10155, partial [Anaerolineaceae bacterium]|nr:hypothetical protein [Anaerolineaceae bacterium]